MSADRPDDFEWCERCQHTHRAGSPCVTECADCEGDLVEEVEAWLGFGHEVEP